MSTLSDEDVKLLNEKQLAHVATAGADGSPHVTPVWVDTDGEHVIFNTAKGRVKYKNIARNPHVGVSVSDRENDYRVLRIQGTAELVEEGADAHIDKLARKYLDADSYPFRKEGEERVIVVITPDKKMGR